MDQAENRFRLQNAGFGLISWKRENGAWNCAVGVGFLAAFFYVQWSYVVLEVPSRKLLTMDDVFLICFVVSALLCGEGIRRLCLFAEERKHVHARYSSDYWRAFDACMHFKASKGIMILGTIASLVVFLHSRSSTDASGKDSCRLPLSSFYVIVLSYIWLMEIFKLKYLVPADVSNLSEADDKNIASGLAWSYYFGYLKLVLPDFPDTLKGMVGEDYQLNGKDLRDFILNGNLKLFVIVPKSCYCQKGVNDSDNRITFVRKMPLKEVSRAGVQKRMYTSSLYCIRVNGFRPIYAALEYATPLLNMYEMSQANANFHKCDMEHQVDMFVRTLKGIIEEDRTIRDNIELILVGDGDENLADALIRKMQTTMDEI